MFPKLDPLLHSELRLAVMSVLAGVESADFTFLKAQTGATAGNLSVQIDKLATAGYIAVEKGFKGKMPCTTCRITHLGRYLKLFDLARERGTFDVVLLLANTDLYGVPVVRYLSDLGIECPVYVDEENLFLGQNPSVPDEQRLRSFFVNDTGAPLCIGDPSVSDGLFQVFLKALDKMPST